MMLRPVLAFIASFARHRFGYRFSARASLERYQERRITGFLQASAARCAFYADKPPQLDQLPIVDKAGMLSAFEQFNTAGIDLETARRIALAAESTRDFSPMIAGQITVGCSSGTSGRPSIFLVSRLERAHWAAAVLARCLTTQSICRILNPFAASLRIAFFLRADSSLYRTLDGRRIRFKFFDLTKDLQSQMPALTQFNPQVLVAPGSVLGHLAISQTRGRIQITPSQVISVAETLEEADARIISTVWCEPQQIYQCTEGVLGFSCSSGSIHLNEECVHFELQWLDTERRRCTAIITDFSRQTQMFVRFRMDDVLHVNPQPCPCGRVSIRLSAIEGRRDGILHLPGLLDGGLRPIFPDQVRRAMLLASETFEDYRLEQHGMLVTIALRTTGANHDAMEAIGHAFKQLCDAVKVHAPVIERMAWPEEHPALKRRRIRCVSKPPEWAPSA